MALNYNFKEEYIELLKETGLFIDKVDRYYKANEEYKNLKKEIDKVLEKTIGAYCKDSERYINPITGEILSLGDIDFNKNTQLKNSLKKLANLLNLVKSFQWKNEVDCSVYTILELGKLKDFEKEILNEFGKKEGIKIIEECKMEILDFEKQNGIYVYTKDVERFLPYNNIKVLYAETKNLGINDVDNIKEEKVILSAKSGKLYEFLKTAKFTHQNNNYIVVELIEKIKMRSEDEYYIYKVENLDSGYSKLVMQEYDDFQLLGDIHEKLVVNTHIAKNKKRVRNNLQKSMTKIKNK